MALLLSHRYTPREWVQAPGFGLGFRVGGTSAIALDLEHACEEPSTSNRGKPMGEILWRYSTSGCTDIFLCFCFFTQLQELAFEMTRNNLAMGSLLPLTSLTRLTSLACKWEASADPMAPAGPDPEAAVEDTHFTFTSLVTISMPLPPDHLVPRRPPEKLILLHPLYLGSNRCWC